jgi:hypothetical protein
MVDQMTKAALLERIAASYASWRAVVDDVLRARMNRAGMFWRLATQGCDRA